MSPPLRTLIFLSSQDVHFLSPPDIPYVESSRVSIDLIHSAHAVFIPSADHSGTVPIATISTPTLNHEDPLGTTSPPPPPLCHSERPYKSSTHLTPGCTGLINQFAFASIISYSPQFQFFCHHTYY